MLNNKAKMKGLYLVTSVVVCLQLLACQFQANTGLGTEEELKDSVIAKEQALTSIVLSNGQLVSNCQQYNHARSEHEIMQTVNNSIVSREYLPCSLQNTSPVQAAEADKIAKQLLTLPLRRLPLSIAQLYGPKALLSEAGFVQIDNKLLWSAEQHSLLVQVKAKASSASNRYLIWVSDVISDGNYRAHYPVWIKTSPKSNSISTEPVYPSGF
jgi:hypothetical protein